MLLIVLGTTSSVIEPVESMPEEKDVLKFGDFAVKGTGCGVVGVERGIVMLEKEVWEVDAEEALVEAERISFGRNLRF